MFHRPKTLSHHFVKVLPLVKSIVNQKSEQKDLELLHQALILRNKIKNISFSSMNRSLKISLECLKETKELNKKFTLHKLQDVNSEGLHQTAIEAIERDLIDLEVNEKKKSNEKEHSSIINFFVVYDRRHTIKMLNSFIIKLLKRDCVRTALKERQEADRLATNKKIKKSGSSEDRQEYLSKTWRRGAVPSSILFKDTTKFRHHKPQITEINLPKITKNMSNDF